MPEAEHLELLVDAGLLQPLARRLERETGRQVLQLAGLSDSATRGVLLASPSSCSPAECAGLSTSGRRVIILAPWSSDFQRAQYLAAGAAGYFVMQLDLSPIVELLRTLA